MGLTPDQMTQALPLQLAYPFLQNNGFAQQVIDIRQSVGRSTDRRARVLNILQQNGLLDAFIQSSWPYASTQQGQRKIAIYNRVFQGLRNENAGQALPNSLTEDDVDSRDRFPLESQLRDYLAENLTLLEQGLSKWPGENDEAIEFPVEENGPSRRIDILAKDRDGTPVIIEFKVNRGHEKTIGQVLYYRSRIKKRFNVEKVRILIVAYEISPELRAAADEVSDTKLFNYSLSVKITPAQ